jgi:hypothetical protein
MSLKSKSVIALVVLTSLVTTIAAAAPATPHNDKGVAKALRAGGLILVVDTVRHSRTVRIPIRSTSATYQPSAT